MGSIMTSGSLATLLALSAAPVFAQPPTYRLTDLGTLGGLFSQPLAMNESGRVTGDSSTVPADASRNHAFLWNGAATQDLGTLGGLYSQGIAINNKGQVIGQSFTSDDRYHGFFWDGSAMLDIGTLGGSRTEVGGINDAGQVTGRTGTAGDLEFRAFLWHDGLMEDLGSGGGAAINNGGQVTGVTNFAGNWHAFLWDKGETRDLDGINGRQSYGQFINGIGQVAGITLFPGEYPHAFLWNGVAMLDQGSPFGNDIRVAGLNDNGQVVGNVLLDEDGNQDRAFVWDGSSFLGLPTLGGTHAWAYAINDAGYATGGSSLSGNSQNHAFLWDGNTVYDLNDLVDPADPLKPYVELITGTAINETGQITATGIDSRTWSASSYLVSPNRPPSNQVDTASGNEVTVKPVVLLPGGAASTVEMTFTSVQSEGTTTILAATTPSGGAPDSPAGFQFGDPPMYFDVETTSTLAGPVTLCFRWEEGQFEVESAIKLFHYENNAWLDVTTTLDRTMNRVCGQVTSLSPFALFERTPYTFAGFYSPVDNLPTINIAKAGQTIPLKWRITNSSGAAVTNLSSVSVSSQAVSCASGAIGDLIEEYSAGNSGLQNLGNGNYQFNWATPKTYANSCRSLVLKLDDGGVHSAQFQFRK